MDFKVSGQAIVMCLRALKLKICMLTPKLIRLHAYLFDLFDLFFIFDLFDFSQIKREPA